MHRDHMHAPALEDIENCRGQQQGAEEGCDYCPCKGSCLAATPAASTRGQTDASHSLHTAHHTNMGGDLMTCPAEVSHCNSNHRRLSNDPMQGASEDRLLFTQVGVVPQPPALPTASVPLQRSSVCPGTG